MEKSTSDASTDVHTLFSLSLSLYLFFFKASSSHFSIKIKISLSFSLPRADRKKCLKMQNNTQLFNLIA